MKRKHLGDENADVPNTSNSRKKARSQPADIADENEFDDTQDTPSKPRSARQKPNGTPNKKPDSPMEAAVIPDHHSPLDPTTPIKRGRGRPKGSKNLPKPDANTPTPKKTPKGKLLFSTPIKPLAPFRSAPAAADTPSKTRNAADRSARRKSTRALIERTINDDGSSSSSDESITRHIYDSNHSSPEDDENPASQAADIPLVPETPSKRGRGRPKGSKNKPVSPPPLSLLPHELYFTQTRSAFLKTSSATLASLPLLDHTEYFSLLTTYVDPHAADLTFLHNLHARSFPQWDFELSQSFSLCLYGFGSKRALLTSYATHLSLSPGTKIVIINGFNPLLTPREILTTLLSLLPSPPKTPGSQAAEILERVLLNLDNATGERKITLLIHSLDAPALRRPGTQAILARLAAHPRINLVASADHPGFPLLWDASARGSFNFVFHDCTTFSPYEAEEVDVVDNVHQLLGRSGRRVGGREGVGFVLRSLPSNARSLFGLVVGEVLAGMDGGEGEGGGGGVEYRKLYQKAVEEFVCGDEVGFRSLLKEFHDHQMITSRKDALGTEILSVPFRREELEGILEDLMG